MAIIRGVPRIYPLAELVTELQRLGTSVGRMAFSGYGKSTGVSSGWYITPDIVIVPGFNFSQSFNPPGFFNKITVDGPGPWQAEVSDTPELLGFGALPQAPQDVAAIALLKLSEPAPSRVLPLCFDTPATGDPLCLVHFPQAASAPSVSFGQVRAVAGDLLEYDADTLQGSSGAPVLDRSWRVLAMHVGSDARRSVNQGLTRAALLKLLQGSRWWGEIRAQHRLADDGAAQAVLQATTIVPAEAPWPDPPLIRAAISPNIDPEPLSQEDKATLADLVVDPTAAKWVMRPGERRRVIEGAKSLAALKEARGAKPTSSDPLQQVINDILDGPPYQIEAAGNDVLSAWIQASRWFEPVAADLPKPSDIARTLARRRVRGQLDTLAGPEFQGREGELGKLASWYRTNPGPFVLTGIGGIGKSALVARFSANLPPSTVLFWLDFDRADLAPDDAVSVLAALTAQAATQLDRFAPAELGAASWQHDGAALGKQLAALTEGQSPPLLVLDSFEAAQYAERYQELWPVIEAVSRELPALRVCVTGRAQVPALSLNGREASSLHLVGLPDEVARHWLVTKGIGESETLERIVELARGIPLILKLALRLVETGGAIADVPRDLPDRLIAGYLYERILDRVQNPEFRPVARGLLVLRRLSVEMITPVLEQLVDLPKGDPNVWFSELSREMGLVEGTSVLLPRREVRSATLWLLEQDQPEFVRDVDLRAAQWYRAQDDATPEYAAELIYHLLRLDDVAGAAAAWREDSAPYLAFAAEDIRGEAAQAWLKDHLGDTSEAAQSLEAWEEDAVRRIRAARARKLDRAPAEILRERTERSAESPLVFHDAFELRASGQRALAIELLAKAGEASGRVGRDRMALHALLQWERGDRRSADSFLQRIEAPGLWAERTGGFDALAILAARIGLMVDVEREAAVLLHGPDIVESLRTVLAPVDVVSPQLRQQLRSDVTLERGKDLFELDRLANDGTALLEAVETERQATLPRVPPSVPETREQIVRQWFSTPGWDGADAGLSDTIGSSLVWMGWRRWWLAATTGFLSEAYELTTSRRAVAVPYAAIAGTLALFAMLLDTMHLNGRHKSLADELYPSVLSLGMLRVTHSRWQRLDRLLRDCISSYENWNAFARLDPDGHGVNVATVDLILHQVSEPRLERADIWPFLLFVLSPNPLLQLVYDLAGFGPDLPLGAEGELL